MIALIQRPPQIVVSGRPAWFILTHPEPGTQIMATISCMGQQVGQDFSFANSKGTAMFELSEYIDTHITPTLKSFSEIGPLVSEDTANESRLSKQFNVVFSDSNGSTTEASLFAIKGYKLPPIDSVMTHAANAPSFHERLIANKDTLTMKRHARIRYNEQPERIHFLTHSQYLDGQTITISTNVMLANGSTNTITNTFTAIMGEVHVIKASYKSLVQAQMQIDPDNKPIGYSVQLFHADDHVSPLYHYVLDLDPSLNTSIMFLNACGAFETLCPSGRLTSEMSVSMDLIHFTTNPLAAQNEVFVASTDIEAPFSINTGPLRKKDALSWLPSLLSSRIAYLVNKDNMPLQIVPSSNSFKFIHHSTDIFSVTMQFVFNNVDSPEIFIPK